MSYSAQYNRMGTDLLCLERKKPFVVYDLTDKSSVSPDPFFWTRKSGFDDAYCFAGPNDELVVTGLKENMEMWSLPDEQSTVDTAQPFCSLRGHQHQVINTVYSSYQNILASCDTGGVIKLWASDYLISNY